MEQITMNWTANTSFVFFRLSSKLFNIAKRKALKEMSYKESFLALSKETN